MRRCKIPAGCKLSSHPCCADCGVRTCEARCWNSPNRCGCWEDSSASQSKATQLGRPAKIDPQKVLALYRQGLLQYQIAQRLGCNPNTVSRILRKLGVTGRG